MPPLPCSGPVVETGAWIHALRRHEPWAWQRLQAESLDTVFGYLAVRCRRREDAEDLTAEVFATAVSAIRTFRGDAAVETWLVSIARRKLIDAARRRKRRPEVLSADLSASDDEGMSEPEWTTSVGERDGDPATQVVRREGLHELRQAVRSLPELQREALLLRCVDQLSIAETARVLGRSENAVKALLHRARSALQGRLRRDGEPAETGRESGHVEKTAAPTCAVPPAR